MKFLLNLNPDLSLTALPPAEWKMEAAEAEASLMNARDIAYHECETPMCQLYEEHASKRRRTEEPYVY